MYVQLILQCLIQTELTDTVSVQQAGIQMFQTAKGQSTLKNFKAC